MQIMASAGKQILLFINMQKVETPIVYRKAKIQNGKIGKYTFSFSCICKFLSDLFRIQNWV
jgi:hypothetical protein